MSLNSMDSSPLSAPDTPRSASSASSPASFSDDPTGPSSPSLDEAHTWPTAEEAAGGSHSQQHAPTETTTKPLKGKEKARKGPLRLLDLPVDVLKEIIHQVGPSKAQHSMPKS